MRPDASQSLKLLFQTDVNEAPGGIVNSAGIPECRSKGARRILSKDIVATNRNPRVIEQVLPGRDGVVRRLPRFDISVLAVFGIASDSVRFDQFGGGKFVGRLCVKKPGRIYPMFVYLKPKFRENRSCNAQLPRDQNPSTPSPAVRCLSISGRHHRTIPPLSY